MPIYLDEYFLRVPGGKGAYNNFKCALGLRMPLEGTRGSDI